MDWYKTSQLYEEVAGENRTIEDDDDRKQWDAEQYFSIGQNEETQSKSYWWVWDGDLHVKKGPTTHGIVFPPSRSNDLFKGVYDSVQNLISVAFPRGFSGVAEKKTEFDIPDELLRSLRRRFGKAKIVCF